MFLESISSKELLLELFKRSDIELPARAYGTNTNDFNEPYDSYQIETKFHLTEEEWLEHFKFRNK